jgi:hypothetical protein
MPGCVKRVWSSATGGEPDVAGLEIAVNDPVHVGVRQRFSDLTGDGDSLSDGEAVLGRLIEHRFEIAADHELRDQVRLRTGSGARSRLFAEIQDRDDVRMIAELRHGARLPLESGVARRVQAVGLDQGKGDVATEAGVMGEIHTLLAALAEEPCGLVATIGKDLWNRRVDLAGGLR